MSYTFGQPCLSTDLSFERMAQDETRTFNREDAEMQAAITTAKKTFRQFLDAFFNPKETQKSFLTKAAFDTGERIEHIWLADLDFSGERPRGVIASEPRASTLRFKQAVDFDPSQITDWMYVDEGRLIGGFTTRVIRDRMSTEERRAHDKQAPYKF